ncbi:MAG: Mov34/MPN/PAD-1 family protein [Chloroflexota bacterium]
MDALTADARPEPQRLLLPAGLRQTMRADAAARAPVEACGVLGGEVHGPVYTARVVLPLQNSLNSPLRYRLDPLEQLAAFEQLEAQGLELVAIYHSHPRGPDGPSAADLAEAFYPEVVYLIWSGASGEWRLSGHCLRGGQAWEVELHGI